MTLKEWELKFNLTVRRMAHLGPGLCFVHDHSWTDPDARGALWTLNDHYVVSVDEELNRIYLKLSPVVP